jgi:hypothetical protein
MPDTILKQAMAQGQNGSVSRIEQALVSSGQQQRAECAKPSLPRKLTTPTAAEAVSSASGVSVMITRQFRREGRRLRLRTKRMQSCTSGQPAEY